MASGKTLQSTIEISGVLSPSLRAAMDKAVDQLAELSDETLETADAATRLVAEMDAQEDVLKTLKRAYAGYVASGEESSEQAQELARKIQTVSNELDDNRSTLQAAEKAVESLGNSQDGLSDDMSESKRAMGQTESAADDLGDAMKEAGEDAEDSGEGYTVLKDIIADLAADAISAAIEGFKELAFEGDAALAMLTAKTGATAETMQGFEDVMYEVYNSNYGESLGDVSEKLSTVIQMTDDLDNASLAQVTKNVIALEDIFGFDVTESMRAVNSLMDQFGITSDEAFNLIVQGAQQGLNQNGDLMDVINEYSVQFKNAGYSANDMFNMLANGTKAGTWSVDKLGDAIKETNIRLSDGTADEALKTLGLGFAESAVDAEELEAASLKVSKAQIKVSESQKKATEALNKHGKKSLEYKKALADIESAQLDLKKAQSDYNEVANNTKFNLDEIKNKLAAGGDTSKEAMQQILSSLMSVEDEQERYVLGQQLMGTMWEDLGEEAVIALFNTEGGINSVNEAMSQADTAAYDTLESSLSQLGRTLKAELIQPLSEKLTPVIKDTVNLINDSVGPAIDWIIEHLPQIGTALGGISTLIVAMKWGKIVSGASKAMGALKGLGAVFGGVSTPALVVIGTIAALVAAFVDLWKNNEEFRNNVTALWEELKESFAGLGESIGGMIQQLVPVFATLATTVLSSIMDIAQALIPLLLQIIEAILPVIIDLIDALLPIITELINEVLTVVIDLINELVPIIVEIIEAVLPVIIDLINQLLPVVMEIIKAILPVIIDLIKKLLPVVTKIINAVLPVIIDLINELVPIITQIIDAVLPVIIDLINELIPIITQVIQQILPVIINLINQLLPVIMQIVQAVLPVLIQLINTLLPVVKQIIDAVLPVLVSILNMLTPILDMIIALLQPIINLFIAMVTPILDLITIALDPIIAVFNILVEIVSGLIEVFSGVWTAIQECWGVVATWFNDNIIAPISEFFTGMWDGLTEGATNAWEGVKSVFSAVAGFFTDIFQAAWEGVKAVFTTGGKVFEGIKDGIVDVFKTVVNGLIDGINTVVALPFKGLNGILDTIHDIEIVGLKPFNWLTWRAPVPQLPKLAAGGFTDGVSIAGEAGTEAVISFDPAYREKNIGIWEQAGQMLGVLSSEAQRESSNLISKAGRLLTLDDFSLGSLANSTQTVIYYDFSGFTWSPHIEGGSGGDGDLMARLKAHEAEFFDWLEEFIKAREAACYA